MWPLKDDPAMLHWELCGNRLVLDLQPCSQMSTNKTMYKFNVKMCQSLVLIFPISNFIMSEQQLMQDSFSQVWTNHASRNAKISIHMR